LLSSLRPGVDIITAGGIHGTIVAMDDAELELEVADGVVLRLDPRAVAEVRPDDDEDEDEDWDDDDSDEGEDDDPDGAEDEDDDSDDEDDEDDAGVSDDGGARGEERPR
jgi:hypothetical protein